MAACLRCCHAYSISMRCPIARGRLQGPHQPCRTHRVAAHRAWSTHKTQGHVCAAPLPLGARVPLRPLTLLASRAPCETRALSGCWRVTRLQVESQTRLGRQPRSSECTHARSRTKPAAPKLLVKPRNITRTHARFEFLLFVHRQLLENRLVGALPTSLGLLTSLTELYARREVLATTVARRRRRVQRAAPSTHPRTCVCSRIQAACACSTTRRQSRNNLHTGRIPSELGELSALTMMYAIGKRHQQASATYTRCIHSTESCSPPCRPVRHAGVRVPTQ